MLFSHESYTIIVLVV